MRTWVAFAVCFLAGLSAIESTGSIPWGSKILRYNYEAQVVTGIKEISNNAAGVGIKAHAVFKPLGGDKIALQLENIRVSKMNEHVHSWREFDIDMSYQAATEEAQKLSLPIVARYQDGQVLDVEDKADDPEWSVNIKRAILTMFNVNLKPCKSMRNKRVNSQNSDDDFPFTYRVKEDGIGGYCRSFYVVESLPSPYFPDAQVMNVTKTRNYKNCDSRPKWMRSTHPMIRASYDDQDKTQLLNTENIVNYDIVGTPERFIIQEVSAEGYTVFAPFTANADELITMHTIELSLMSDHKEVEEFGSGSDEQPRGRRLEASFESYETMKQQKYLKKYPRSVINPGSFQPRNYYGKYQKYQVSGEDTDENSSNEADSKITHLQYRFPGVSHTSPAGEDLREPNPFDDPTEDEINEKKDAKKQMNKLIEAASPHDAEPFSEAPVEYLQAVKMIRKLNYDEIMQAVHEVIESKSGSASEKLMAKRLVTDCVVAAGTNPSILAVMNMVEKQIITGEIANQAIMAIPTYVINPSYKIIEKLLALVHSINPAKERQLYKTTVLAVAELVGQACSPRKYTTPLAVNMRKTSCTEQMGEKYVQELASMLRSASHKGVKATLLQALGQTAHPAIIRVLKPFAQGDVTDDEYLRTKAIYALSRVSNFTEEAVQKVLRPIFYDSTESTEVRLAAFDVLLETNDPKYFLERTAKFTWEEPNEEVVSYIYSTLQSLKNATTPAYAYMTEYAKIAADIAKPYKNHGIQYSKNYFFTNFAEQFGLGSNLHVSLIQGRQSVIPRIIYVRLGRVVANYWAKPIEFAIHTKGIQTIIDRTLGPKGAFRNFPTLAALLSPESESKYASAQMKQELNSKHRREEPLQVSAFINLLGTQSRQFYLDHKKVLELAAEYGQDLKLSSLLRSLESGTHMQYSKAMNLLDISYHVANPTGLPLILSIDAPAVLNVQAQVKADLPSSQEHGLRNARLSVDVSPRIAARLIARMGVAAPFLRVFAGAGVQVKAQAALPAKLEVSVDQNSKLSFSFKPATTIAPEAQPKLKFEVVPFTVINSWEDSKPLIKCIKPIKTMAEPRDFEHDLSEYAFGAPLVLRGEHELQFYGPAAHHARLTKHGLLNALNFFWATPETKYRKVELEFDQQGSHQQRHLQVTFNVEYTPSEIAKPYYEGQYEILGSWGKMTGWTRVPSDCAAESVKEYEESYGAPSHGSSSSWRQYLSSHSSRFDELYFKQQSRKQRLQESNEDSDSDSDESSEEYNQQQQAKHSSYRTQSGRSQFDEHRPYGGSPSAQAHVSQKMPIFAAPGPKVRFTLKAVARGSGERTVDAELLLVKESPLLYKADYKLKLSPAVTPSDVQFDLCGSAFVKYPKQPCSYIQRLDPRSTGKIFAEAQMSWGQQSCEASNYIKIQAVADKSEKQLRKEEHPSAWYFHQCQKDQSKGQTFSWACQKTEADISSLNRVKVNAEWSRLPTELRNWTYGFDDFMKAAYYMHMSNNRIHVNNPANKLKLEVEVEEDRPVVNIRVQKPEEDTLFHNIYSPFFGTYFLPIPTRTNPIRKIKNILAGGELTPECQVSGDRVWTFDNNTIKVPLTPCYHVLAKDCSPSHLFTVLARQTSENHKTVEVRLLKHSIVVPSPNKGSEATFIVDGQKHTVAKGQAMIVKAPEEGQPIATLAYSGVTAYVNCPYHAIEVSTDGYNIHTEVSNLWRGEVCGICGEMMPSENVQLLGPAKCVHPNGKSLAMAYMLPEGQCHKPQQPHKLCLDEEQNQEQRTYEPYQGKDWSEESSSTSSESDETEDVVEMTIVKKIGSGANRQICFSIQPVPRCAQGYRPARREYRRVSFHCLVASAPKARELEREAETRTLDEMHSKSVTMIEEVLVEPDCDAKSRNY